mgnify:CR=1 FL=1
MNPNERFEVSKGLVYFAVNRLTNTYSASLSINTLEKEDAIQLGYIGLWKACQKFDESKGFKFSTYAIPAITGEIINTYRESFGTIKMPRRCKIAAKKISQRIREGGATPTIKEIQEEFEFSQEDARITLEIMELRVLSSDAPIPGQKASGRDLFLSDIVEDPNAFFEEAIIRSDELRERIALLDERERKIFALMFNGKTQSEIGKVIGLSQVQVSRIYKKALEKIRKYNEVTANENEPQLA